MPRKWIGAAACCILAGASFVFGDLAPGDTGPNCSATAMAAVTEAAVTAPPDVDTLVYYDDPSTVVKHFAYTLSYNEDCEQANCTEQRSHVRSTPGTSA